MWGKESGPGTVAFGNSTGLVTTATFSAPGSYVLKLTANNAETNASSTLHVKVEEPPPADRLDVVYTKKYKIDSPLWNSRVKALVVNWIPHCIDQINRTDLTQGQGGIDNFIEAAKAIRGESHEKQKGYVFANAWVHQTVESMSIALMIDPQGDKEIIKAQQKMKATLDDWIPKILAAQEPDGYLQTAWTLRDPNGRWKERWSAAGRGNHEGYVSGYFIESAINHYTMTNGKDKRLYDAAKKLADCWVANIGPGKKDWYDGHQEMEQALVRFGRFVNDMEGNHHGDAYIKLGKFLLDCRRSGSEYDQSHVPVQQQYEAVGHAVRAVYSYSGMADVAAETHDIDYQSAVKSIWDNIVNKKYYVTGGIGSGETSEGFGPNYSLRNNAYCESCSTCGLIFFQYKMNLAYHDARYADLYEESIYNALLGAIDLKGENFYYDNPLNGGPDRYPWHTCPCCVGNIPRTLLMIPTWTYAKDKDSLYVNLYIGSTIKVEKVAGTNIEMIQKTDYPWSGNISIKVNPEKSKRFSIYLRVPNRATSELYTSTPAVNGLKLLKVNGKPVTAKIDKGYAVITRTWRAGDKIDLQLPMQVQRIKPDERIVADQGREALRYGPLIYNVERADNQDITKSVSSVVQGSPANSIVRGSHDSAQAPTAGLPLSGVTAQSATNGLPQFTTEWRSDLLGGVMVIKGTWSDGSPLVAVPNYVRNNRNTGLADTSAELSPSEALALQTSNNAQTGAGTRGRSSRPVNSMVWMKGE